ncbi:uncharacterized protein TNCT_18441 [Trichonephila clavata]|uniref:Uncharacterized protein n=1 Tax=Trichonephila clavata TaxID=2740835 RepID=A0A8X6HRY9_TRICU|nr:uncharacterized protein TNCT_18441 [Trichonephila clavata]
MIFITSLIFSAGCFGFILCDLENDQVNSENASCSSEYLFPQFPECQEFEDLIREKRIELRRNGELSAEDCESLGPMECLRNETLYARYQINSLPPAECMLPMIQFLFGHLVQDFAYDYSSEEYAENKLE